MTRPAAQPAGYGVAYVHPVTDQVGFRFWPDPSEIPDVHDAIFVLDNGHAAIPHYVAGWKDDEEWVNLNPFPVNPDGKTRADRPDEVIDYSTWFLGPRRVYHFKISDVD